MVREQSGFLAHTATTSLKKEVKKNLQLSVPLLRSQTKQICDVQFGLFMDQTFVSYESSCLLNLRLLSSDASSVSLFVYMLFWLMLNKIFPENVTVETFMMRDKLQA